jgi:hypothetical protein
MIDKQEREKIESRYDAADEIIKNIKMNEMKMLQIFIILESRQDIPALLDALEESISRAETLERALKSQGANSTVLRFACYTCIHKDEDVTYCAEICGRDCRNWQFDETRFSDENQLTVN